MVEYVHSLFSCLITDSDMNGAGSGPTVLIAVEMLSQHLRSLLGL